MDFGLLGLDGLVNSEPNTTARATMFAYSDPEAKQKCYGSGNLKQERSCIAQDEDGRCSKLLKMDRNNISASEAMSFKQRNCLGISNGTSFFSEGQQQPAEQMLSFTSPNSDGLLVCRNGQNVTLPYLQYYSSAQNINTSYNFGSFNGPFTSSQWMELEHQALIYKYIIANVPVPSNLLIPIKKALESAGFSSFPAGILRPTLGWGSFHMGFSHNTDPEPGRCRRTDGKKWRCSRDAVADQKYCERHMNRGRHRSRKPVECRNAHSATGTTTSSSKLMSCASSSASVVASSGASNSLPSANQHIQDRQTGASNLSAESSMNRMLLNNENVGDRMLGTAGLAMLSSSADLKYKSSPFLIGKQQIACVESSPAAFGHVSSDSLVNPSHKGTSLVNCRDFASQNPSTEAAGSHSLRHFIDDWPKNKSDRVAVSWPELDMQKDRTQLSMSTPLGSADFMSSTSSPTNEKVTLLPLRLSRELELDSIQMGLGVGGVVHEANQRQANRMPITWEHSLGGPLGEVLHSTNNSGSDCKNSSSSLNLMTEGWDNNHWMGSSPTGVLQKSTFASLSNSSAGSSPRTENNKTHEGASHCKDVLNSTPANSSSVPTL